MQEVDLNDAAWNEVVSTRLPANLEEQARQLQAWSRKREVRSAADLLRALLVSNVNYLARIASWENLTLTEENAS